ncbi:MAG: pyridoxamine 5'-phosphate oxidase family protein [Burkholderiales bacterium]|nr:pyridoxamine 5'-phosphate oxidase family protein [Burkholderiales bacterium]
MDLHARFSEVVTSEAQLRAVTGEPAERAARKQIAFLDAHCRAFIARSPFVLVSSIDADGRMDVSPKGDPPGFVRVLDERTLAIPDRPGNRRADTFRNLLARDAVGLIFLVPGKRETLRVSGRAIVVRDRALRESMAIAGKLPELALVVAVEEAMFHCAKCMIRSNLWNPAAWPDLSGLPTLGEALIAAGHLDATPAALDAQIERDYAAQLY